MEEFCLGIFEDLTFLEDVLRMPIEKYHPNMPKYTSGCIFRSIKLVQSGMETALKGDPPRDLEYCQEMVYNLLIPSRHSILTAMKQKRGYD